MAEYSVQPSENRDYVILTVKGDFTAGEMMGYVMEAHALGSELGVNRFLLDVTAARNVDSELGNYNFAYSDMKNAEGLDPDARVAGLVSSGDRSHDFIETVLRNAMLPMKNFTDRDEALAFLFAD